MVMPRTETMPGFNHIELDEVHTPSRYFAPAFICLLGRSIVLFTLCFLPVANQLLSFLLSTDLLAPDLSEASQRRNNCTKGQPHGPIQDHRTFSAMDCRGLAWTSMDYPNTGSDSSESREPEQPSSLLTRLVASQSQ
jgi:hypothetical protein